MDNNTKFETVITKNTFYFFNPHFEESYESHINSLKETLLVVQQQIIENGLKKEIFENLLRNKENGLTAILTLTGFANESLKRIITVSRVSQNPELLSLLNYRLWNLKNLLETEIQQNLFEDEGFKETGEIMEWSDAKLKSMIRTRPYFCKGIINLFFEGSTIPYLVEIMPLFEIKKLGISKLNFEIPGLIDTLIRYKEKGSYSGHRLNNPEIIIQGILNALEIPWETGDLTDLIKSESVTKRTMDFIVPNRKNPILIIECSFLVTTSSGQGDKSKTEVGVSKLIKTYFPNAHFFGFVDGIGWYVRKGDLARMVEAYDDVFTFHKTEIERFENALLDLWFSKA